MILTGEKQELGEKGVVVPLGPTQSYMDTPKRPVSPFNNRTSTSKVAGWGGGGNIVTKTMTNVIYCAGFESLGEKES